ncbi:hypothetical protein GCM10010440_75520 [Kitasatospora cinereorecta]
MNRPPRLMLNPWTPETAVPPCDPATYAPTALGTSFRVVPLATLNQLPAAPVPLPRRRRRPTFDRVTAPTGPLFAPAASRPAGGRNALGAWFAGSSNARRSVEEVHRASGERLA